MQISQQAFRAQPCTRCRRPATAVRCPRVTTHSVETATQAVTADITSKDVTQLLDTLTQSEFCELKLEMGDVKIKVRRDLEPTPAVAAAPAPAAVAGSVPSYPTTVIAPAPHMEAALRLAPAPYQSLDEDGIDDSLDEALLYVTANRVGVFRRGKSKCKVGDQVKKGQVLGAIEQLGTMVDVKSPQEGEIVAYKVADGDPVEYGGPIVALAPYFNLEDAGKTQLRGIS